MKKLHTQKVIYNNCLTVISAAQNSHGRYLVLLYVLHRRIFYTRNQGIYAEHKKGCLLPVQEIPEICKFPVTCVAYVE